MFLSFRTAVPLAIVVLALASVGTATGSKSNRGAGVCPVLSGVKWVLPYAPYTSGTKYDLHVNGKITCGQATPYVKKLVAMHVHTNVAFAGGPTGWTCKASASKTGLAYTGTCQPKSEGFLPHDYFVWTVG